jgi:hypothetical protein
MGGGWYNPQLDFSKRDSNTSGHPPTPAQGTQNPRFSGTSIQQANRLMTHRKDCTPNVRPTSLQASQVASSRPYIAHTRPFHVCPD